jgi:hypothetical protein
MSGYESALVGLVQILEELMQSGTAPDRAGHELASAIAEGAISLFGPNGPIVEIEEIGRIAGDVEKMTALYGAMRRGAKMIKLSEVVWLQYLRSVMVFRDQFKMAFGIISELEQPPAAQKARSGGPKPKYEWDLLETKGRQLMDYHGDFDPGDPQWNAQARLEEALLKFHREKWETEPSITSLRIKLREWLPRWRADKRRS